MRRTMLYSGLLGIGVTLGVLRAQGQMPPPAPPTGPNGVQPANFVYPSANPPGAVLPPTGTPLGPNVLWPRSPDGRQRLTRPVISTGNPAALPPSLQQGMPPDNANAMNPGGPAVSQQGAGRPQLPSMPNTAPMTPGYPGPVPEPRPPAPPAPTPGPTPPPTPAPTPAPPPGPMPGPMPSVTITPTPSAPAPVPPPDKPKASAPAPSATPPAAVPVIGSSPNAGPASRVAPSVFVETTGPESVGVGQQMSYEIVVRNVGPVPVFQVRVEDEMPQGVRYLGGEPAAEVSGERVQWVLGALEAGAEKRIKVDVRPTAEGELRTRATVSFSATSSFRARVTRPKLTVAVTGPESVQVGDAVPFQITITNSGTGAANKLTLRAELTEGLQHPGGSVIEAPLAHVQPGETRTIDLRAVAGKAGSPTCTLTVLGDGAGEATARATVRVSEPHLLLKQTGPARCLVRGEPTFAVEVSNPGSSPTAPVVVTETVPDGLEFVSASDGGTYEPASRAVVWNLGPQPPGSKRELKLKARAQTAGDWVVKASAQAGPRLDAKAELSLHVEGVPALTFEVVDLDGPVEVGKETTLEVRLVNRGTSACTNIQVGAALSEGLTPTNVVSPVPHRTQGQNVLFEPIPRLAAKADAVIRLKVRGGRPGDPRVKVQVSCDQARQPVVKEESTRFYKE